MIIKFRITPNALEAVMTPAEAALYAIMFGFASSPRADV